MIKKQYSNKKITCSSRATANKAFTSFSPSPTYFDVNVAALMLKKVALHSDATALASNVFPLPGGPNKSNPLAGALNPVNISGRNEGKITISCKACFAIYKDFKFNNNILS
jgi:hypothetical protein